jgi:hypothetical protein
MTRMFSSQRIILQVQNIYYEFWNHLDENTVPAEKLESFKSALADHHD